MPLLRQEIQKMMKMVEPEFPGRETPQDQQLMRHKKDHRNGYAIELNPWSPKRAKKWVLRVSASTVTMEKIITIIQRDFESMDERHEERLRLSTLGTNPRYLRVPEYTGSLLIWARNASDRERVGK